MTYCDDVRAVPTDEDSESFTFSCSDSTTQHRSVPEPTTPSDAVICAVSTATGVDPLDLPPLYEAIDPDALDGLFAASEDAGEEGDGRQSIWVTFDYADRRVTADSDGFITVERAADLFTE